MPLLYLKPRPPKKLAVATPPLKRSFVHKPSYSIPNQRYTESTLEFIKEKLDNNSVRGYGCGVG